MNQQIRLRERERDKEKIIKTYCKIINNFQNTNVRGEALFAWRMENGVINRGMAKGAWFLAPISSRRPT